MIFASLQDARIDTYITGTSRIRLLKIMKKKSNKLIYLNTYGTTGGDLINLKNEVALRIGSLMVNTNDWQTLLYNVLKQFNGIETWVQKDEVSIEKASLKIMHHFYRSRQIPLDTLYKTDAKPKEQKGTFFFRTRILELDELPYNSYLDLKSKVEHHLSRIQVLIKKYEMLITNQKNNEQRMYVDFHKRCIEERDRIIHHLLHGLRQTAIEKCRYTYGFSFGVKFAITQVYRDFPYKFAFSSNDGFFDYTRINKALHRLDHFYIDQFKELSDLYEKNKPRFYLLFFKQRKKDDVFQNIQYNLAQLPTLKKRKPIFDELKRLFKSKRWLSFNALALPQVEGLFSEMIEIANPAKKALNLSDKVQLIRPSFNFDQSYLDYYQYIIPELRNRFMHYGVLPDIANDKITAFDLLTDLDHILSVFVELEIPQIIIQKIHARRNQEDFISFNQFAEYFLLLNRLSDNSFSKETKSMLENERINFEKSFIIPCTDIEYICEQLIIKLPELINEITIQLEYALGDAMIALSVREMKKEDFKKMLSDPSFVDKIRHFIVYDQKLDELHLYEVFLKNYKYYLPSLSKNITSKLNSIKSEYIVFILNLIEAKKLIEDTD